MECVCAATSYIAPYFQSLNLKDKKKKNPFVLNHLVWILCYRDLGNKCNRKEKDAENLGVLMETMLD